MARPTSYPDRALRHLTRLLEVLGMGPCAPLVAASMLESLWRTPSSNPSTSGSSETVEARQ